MDGRKVKFKIDTGSGVIVILNHMFNQIYNNDTPKLIKSKESNIWPRIYSTGYSRCYEHYPLEWKEDNTGTDICNREIAHPVIRQTSNHQIEPDITLQ